MSAYETNEDPYNETGGRWVKEPPKACGFYWVRSIQDGWPCIAWRNFQGWWWQFANECDQHRSDKDMIADGNEFWSEPIKEPR